MNFQQADLGKGNAGNRRDSVLIAILVIAFAVVFLYSMPLTLMAIAGLLLLLMTPLAPWGILIYCAVVMGLSGVLDYHPVNIGAFNVYAIDALGIVFFWTAVWVLVKSDPTKQLERPYPTEHLISMMMVIWCSLCVVFLFNGHVVHDTPFDRAFGDIRRQGVYATAYFVPLLFPYSTKQLRSFRWVIIGAALLTIAVGTYRISTGTVARIDENYETGHLGVRMMHIVECMTLATALSYCVLLIRFRRTTLNQAIVVPIIFASILLLVLSGFRLAMGFTVGVPILTILLAAYARRDSVRDFAAPLVLIVLVVAISLMLVPIFMPEQFDKLLLDLQLRLANTGVQGGFRTWAFEAAMRGFADSPILGQGFGQYLVVATRNQSGVFDYVEMSNPHNMFLGVLYQTGLAGAIPFALFHGIFIVHALRSSRNMPIEWLPLYLSCFAGYLCYIGYSNTQPFVSSQYIIMHLLMGLVLRLARLAKPADHFNHQPAMPAVS